MARHDISSLVSQELYKEFRGGYNEFMGQCKKALDTAEQTRVDKFKDPGSAAMPLWGNRDEVAKHMGECGPNGDRMKLAKKLIAKQAYNLYGEEGVLGNPYSGRTHKAGFQKSSGVFSALGYNFYDLRAPVLLLYPVNVPFRNEIPRVGRVNDGYGTAAHWIATRNVGTPYAGASEGHRVSIGTPDENPYVASYKELGDERNVSFTAQFAGEGFADNLADEHLRGLHSLWLQEEGLNVLGNGGVGSVSNGYQLATCPTPTTAAKAVTFSTPDGVSRTYTSTFTGTTATSVACVALTGMGNPATAQYGYNSAPTVANGLVPRYTRTNADGSQDLINGGMSAVSAVSSSANGDTTHVVLAQIPAASLPYKGAYGYAWFSNVTDSTLANSYLIAITSNPWVVITGPTAASGLVGGSIQTFTMGTQQASATNLNLDNSANQLDYDGLLSYVVSGGGYYKDMQGATLTSGKDGTCVEVETVLQTIFQNFQAGVDEIWGDPLGILCLDKAIRYGGSSATGFQFMYTRDQQDNILGGYVVSAYKSRYVTNNPTGANAIPIRMHPMLPPGTLYFELTTNPYPHSRQTNVREMLVQRDYYSIEWPVVTRQWGFGTYSHQVLRHNMPWIPALIVGIGAFVAN